MRFAALLFSIALAGTACSKKSEPPADQTPAQPAQPTEAQPTQPAQPAGPLTGEKAAFEARRTFQTVCSTCHGTDGKGDGPAAAALKVKPRNYTDKAWQTATTDDQIKKIILEGGPAVGKDAAMPPQPQLKDQPEVLSELVKMIRAFGA